MEWFFFIFAILATIASIVVCTGRSLEDGRFNFFWAFISVVNVTMIVLWGYLLFFEEEEAQVNTPCKITEHVLERSKGIVQIKVCNNEVTITESPNSPLHGVSPNQYYRDAIGVSYL
jgi:predicted cation transporter